MPKKLDELQPKDENNFFKKEVDHSEFHKSENSIPDFKFTPPPPPPPSQNSENSIDTNLKD